MQRLGLPVCSLRVDRNHLNETGRLYDRQKLNKEIFMVAIRPVPSTNQLAHLLASGPKGPIDVPMPLRDGFPPPTNNNGGKRPTQFPDPDNRHIFLVPPRDNNQPELELDSGKRDAKPSNTSRREGVPRRCRPVPQCDLRGAGTRGSSPGRRWNGHRLSKCHRRSAASWPARGCFWRILGKR